MMNSKSMESSRGLVVAKPIVCTTISTLPTLSPFLSLHHHYMLNPQLLLPLLVGRSVTWSLGWLGYVVISHLPCSRYCTSFGNPVYLSIQFHFTSSVQFSTNTLACLTDHYLLTRTFVYLSVGLLACLPGLVQRQ